MSRYTRPLQGQLNRDFVWTLLWRLHQPGWPNEGWVTSRRVYDLWRDDRNECGIVWADDYIGPRNYFTYCLNRLVDEGRAEKRRRPKRHPEYRVIEHDTLQKAAQREGE